MATQRTQNSIFLTGEESERIRSAVRLRLQQCSKESSNAREARDKVASLQQVTGASLMADMGGAPDPDITHTQEKGDTIPALAVGQAYPPCISSLDDLESMSFADLRIETHHRGKKLIVKRAAPVVTLIARSWTMVHDEDEKETERLEMCLHKTRFGEDVLESAKQFIIKDPYFTLTDQGEPTLRIDHPSDLVICDDAWGVKQYADTPTAVTATTSCKIQGNAALKIKDLPLAYEKYSQGLTIAKRDIVFEKNPDLARDISRNRAYINLLLERFDEALTDARHSLVNEDDVKSNDLDSKAHYRAGGAAYNLQRFTDAQRLFEAQQKLAPDDRDAKTYLKRIKARLREQDTGVYDFAKLSAGASRANPKVDVANFLNKTRIKDIPGQGRGLFATTKIAAGEIIMVEKAFCIVWGWTEQAQVAMTYDIRDDKIRVSPIGLTRAIVQKLLNNPSTLEEVMQLYSDWTGTAESKNIFSTTDGPVVDIFRIHDIMSRNTFSPGAQFGEQGARDASTGLWMRASYINHSCVPNAQKSFVGDAMIFRALRSIKADEEIVHSYDSSLDFDTRQAALMTTWGFECTCPLCTAEKEDGKEVRDRRMTLVGEADAFIDKTSWADAKRMALRRGKQLEKSIGETYHEERWKDLPRVHGGEIRQWLAKATPRQ